MLTVAVACAVVGCANNPEQPDGQPSDEEPGSSAVSLTEALKELFAGFRNLDGAAAETALGVIPCHVTVDMGIDTTEAGSGGGSLTVGDLASIEASSESSRATGNSIHIEMRNPKCS